jgi:hypothetical protein
MLLVAEGLTKRFGGVAALTDVAFEVAAGEAVARSLAHTAQAGLRDAAQRASLAALGHAGGRDPGGVGRIRGGERMPSPPCATGIRPAASANDPRDPAHAAGVAGSCDRVPPSATPHHHGRRARGAPALRS